MATTKAHAKKKAWRLEVLDLTDEEIITGLRTASAEAIEDQRRIEQAKIVRLDAMELEVSI